MNGGANRALHAAYSAATLRIVQTEAAIADYESRIGQLEETIRAQGISQADKLENLDQVVAEMARLRGNLEVLHFQVNEVKRTVDSAQVGQERRMMHAEARLRQVEGFLNLRPPPPPSDAELGLAIGLGETPAEAVGTPLEPAAPPLPSTAPERLALARGHLTEGRPAVARAILLKTVEENAGASEMDEVRYRLAESWFDEGNWKTAGSKFQTVIDNHPKSDWACWAQYRMGECFEHLNNADGASLFFLGATEGRCAKSAAAKEARKKL